MVINASVWNKKVFIRIFYGLSIGAVIRLYVPSENMNIPKNRKITITKSWYAAWHIIVLHISGPIIELDLLTLLFKPGFV
jgi:hypothetical protein